MKLMICGHGRHGKDQFCEFLGLEYTSSSMVALDKIIWPEFGKSYASKEECFEDRINHRVEWHQAITEYNTPDLTRLARDIFAENMVYCGIRNREEFYAAKEGGLFDLSIWIDASGRHPPESEASCKMLPSDCDIIVTNNGSLEELRNKAEALKKALGFELIATSGPGWYWFDEATNLEAPTTSVKDLITEWADKVFPDRTITNAIQKMVLEEIPEYLMAQDDPMELADLGILLYDIAYLAGFDLDTIIRQKMEINKNRSWAVNPITGMMKHVKEGEAKKCPLCHFVMNKSGICSACKSDPKN